MSSAQVVTAETGIASVGVYVPRLRMERAAIAKAHGWMSAKPAAPKGFKAYCSWDEDAVTMAVEAGRRTLADSGEIQSFYLASSTLPFADLQNSAIVADALRLPQGVAAMDVAGSRRSGTSALLSALRSKDEALVVASEAAATKPASAQELLFGAGAAAVRVGRTGVIAEFLSGVTRSAFFVDSFRAAQNKFDYAWEERWIRDEGYLRLVPECASAALRAAGVEAVAVSHFIMPAPQSGVTSAVAKRIGVPEQACAPGQGETIGYAGAADPLLTLAGVLEQAQPGQIILLLGFGQGVDAIVLRTTALLAERRSSIGFSRAVADRIEDSAYLRMLSFQDSIELEWGMRAEKDVKTALTEQYRSLPQIGPFMAGKCEACGTIQFPQLSYCVNTECAAPAAQFSQVSLADAPAKVFTFTADWLSYHPAPPLYVGFIQFDNGARILMEIVDVGPAGISTGMPVRMVFRVKDHDKPRGYKRYFWKATPVSVDAPAGGTA